MLLTVEQMAALLGLQKRAVYDLAAVGTIPRRERGRYHAGEVVLAYTTHMREVAAGRTDKSGKVDLAAERARLARMQADAQEIKNAVLRGELVPADEIEAASIAVHSAVQRRLLALPRKLAPLVAVENEPRACEEIIREHVVEALQKIADTEVEVDASTSESRAASEH